LWQSRCLDLPSRKWHWQCEKCAQSSCDKSSAGHGGATVVPPLGTTGMAIEHETVGLHHSVDSFVVGRLAPGLPLTIEWLSDNASCYVAGDTRRFGRDIGLEPRTTPIEIPQQSNGMAEAFV
jgi:hypothetical protein